MFPGDDEEVIITAQVSNWYWLEEQGGPTWPRGKEVRASVSTADVKNLLNHMLAATRDNTFFRVEVLDPSSVVVIFRDRLTDLLPGFPEPDGGWDDVTGWCYVFAMDPQLEFGPLKVVYEVLWDLCSRDSRLCSPKMVEQLAQ